MPSRSHHSALYGQATQKRPFFCIADILSSAYYGKTPRYFFTVSVISAGITDVMLAQISSNAVAQPFHDFKRSCSVSLTESANVPSRSLNYIWP